MHRLQHDGGHGRLECRIDRKILRAASGSARTLFRDLSFHVAEGQVLALVGPSGCGKTTLLRMIAGLDRDFDGEITGLSDRRIGMVFQEPNLLPWRNVEENVRLVAPSLTNDALLDLLANLGLLDHRRHFPGELSLGLARRVAIARALAYRPQLLVLDEPFASLDRSLAIRLRDDIVKLIVDRRLTALFVSHDLDDAIAMADRIAVMSGTPTRFAAEIEIAKPRSAMTATEIEAIKANIAKGFA